VLPDLQVLAFEGLKIPYPSFDLTQLIFNESYDPSYPNDKVYNSTYGIEFESNVLHEIPKYDHGIFNF